MAAKYRSKARKLNIEIDQGATLCLPMTWTDSSGVAVPMASWTGRMQIRDVSDDSLIIELTTSNSGIELGATDGSIQINITSTETTAFTFERGEYDLELIDTAGKVRRFIEGNVTLSLEVTV